MIGQVIKTEFLVGRVLEIIDLPPIPQNPNRRVYYVVSVIAPDTNVGQKHYVREDEVQLIGQDAIAALNADIEDEDGRHDTEEPEKEGRYWYDRKKWRQPHIIESTGKGEGPRKSEVNGAAFSAAINDVLKKIGD